MQLVIFFSTGGKHNDRNVFPLLDFLAGGKAVQSWHHNIHNNQVKVLFPTEGNGFHAIFCLCHFIFFKLSIFPNDVPDICFIIDYQQTIHLYLASFLFLRKNRPKIGRFLIFAGNRCTSILPLLQKEIAAFAKLGFSFCLPLLLQSCCDK